MECISALNLVEILNAMEDSIYITRRDYTIEFMNQSMIDLFGRGIGKKCYEIINAGGGICPWCRAGEIFEHANPVRAEIHIPGVDRTFRIIGLPIKNVDNTIFKLNIYRDITRRKDQELRLKATEEDYRRLFENVAAGVYSSSKEGRFINVNKALVDMLGYANKEELLNINIQKNLYKRSADRLAFQRMIEEDGQVVNYPVDFKRKDGNTLPVLLTARVRLSREKQIMGYEGICVDQTQIVMMEQKIRETHDMLNNMIQSSPNAIIGADMEGLITIWNKGAEETLGYKAEDVVDKMDVRQLYEGGMAYEVMRKMRSDEFGGKGKLRSYPMIYRHHNGSLVDGNLSANIIYDDDGNEVMSAGYFVDLVERLEMERKLHHTQEQLLQSEKLAAMGRLTSQLAHELNNPLYGIMNTLELMKTEIPPDNRRRKLLEMSLSETVRLTDMLRKMLSFSKPDQEARAPVDINTIIDEVMLLYQKQMHEVDIRVNLKFAEGLQPVMASKNQLRQVFINMISNAKDAMPKGGVLSITTSGDDAHICVEISDTGVGIKPENLDRIFDTFFTTKSESVKGVGLGLSVCYGFIADHGGDINVESRLGVGTTFNVIVPAIQAGNT